MIRRFRMIAGPNGSGKTTLVNRLRDEHSVNFYSFVNADDILAQVLRTGGYSPKFPITKGELVKYAETSSYDAEVRSVFRSEAIQVTADCVRFEKAVVNSYTIALFANFLQDRFIERGESFSQETVFSHPSKVTALKRAQDSGYRTYLYFIATAAPVINAFRVANRHTQGGHDVPIEKIISRYSRSIEQFRLAIPYLSRAYVFDNSGSEMVFLGEYEKESGWTFAWPITLLPAWLSHAL